MSNSSAVGSMPSRDRPHNCCPPLEESGAGYSQDRPSSEAGGMTRSTPAFLAIEDVEDVRVVDPYYEMVRALAIKRTIDESFDLLHWWRRRDDRQTTFAAMRLMGWFGELNKLLEKKREVLSDELRVRDAEGKQPHIDEALKEYEQLEPVRHIRLELLEYGNPSSYKNAVTQEIEIRRNTRRSQRFQG